MKASIKIFTVLFIVCISFFDVNAATYYSRVSSGNWNTASSWSTVACNGAAAASVPGAGDNVIICSGHTIVMNGNPGACLSLTLSGSASFSSAYTTNVGTGGITINASGNIIGSANGFLTTTGNLINNRTLTTNSVTIVLQTTGGQTISGTGSVAKLTINANTTNNGTLTVRSALTGSATLTQGAAGILNYAGTAAIGCTLDASAAGNTVNYSGTSTQTISSATYYNLTNSNAGVSTLGGNITVNNNLTISGGTLASSTYQITGNASGVFSMSSSTILTLGTTASATVVDFPTNFTTSNISLATTSTVTYQGNYAQSISTAPSTYGNLTITTGATTVTKTLSPAADVSVAGNLALSVAAVTLNMGAQDLTVTGAISGTGSLTMSGGDLTVSGSFSNSGTFTCGTGTVNYNGAAQNVKSTTYNNLTISGSGIKTLAGNIIVNGNLAINAGTLAMSTRSITGNATGTFTMAASTTLTIGNVSSATNVNFPSNFTNPNISFASGSTVTYQGNSAQTISSVPNYQNLTITTYSSNKSANGNLTVQGDLSTTTSTLRMLTYTLNLTGNYIGAGGLSFSTGTFNITGSYTNSGTFTCGTGTVNYNGTSSQTVRGTTYYNLQMTNSGAKTLGAAAIVTNDFTINNNSNLDVSSSDYGIQVRRHWVNNGTFTAQEGTVTFNGSVAQTINGSGTTAFYGLTISNTNGVSLSGGSYSLSDALTLSNGTFTTNGNSFIMLSTDTKTARIAPVTGTGAVNGNFIIQRHIAQRTAGSLTWTCIASPVVSTTFQDWDDELFFYYPHDPNNPPYDYSNVLMYDELTAEYVGVTAGTTLNPGEGTEIFLTDDENLLNFSETTLNTIGQPTIGDQTINLDYNTTAYGGAYAGQNLVGNPFASSIQVNGMTFTNALTSVDVYDNVSDSYLTLSGTDEIAPHQAFWAYATTTGASVGVPETAKTTSTNGTLKSSDIPSYMTLKILSGDGSHNMAHTLKISSDVDAKDGWDHKDHPFRKSLQKKAPSITAPSEKAPLSITTFNSNHQDYTLPLIVKVGVDGKYKIQAKNVIAMAENFSCVLLKDNVTGEVIDLNKTEEYVFFAQTTDNENRFAVYFSKSGECKISNSNANNLLNNVQILQSPEGAIINFNMENETPCKIILTNLIGQEIATPINVIAYTQSIQIPVSANYQGIYLIKVSSDKGEIVKKIFKP